MARTQADLFMGWLQSGPTTKMVNCSMGQLQQELTTLRGQLLSMDKSLHFGPTTPWVNYTMGQLYHGPTTPWTNYTMGQLHHGSTAAG